MQDRHGGRAHGGGSEVVARKLDPEAVHVPGRRTLVEAELGGAPVGAHSGPGKRTRVEQQGPGVWAAGPAAVGSFDAVVALARRHLGELQVALAAGDRGRVQHAAAALDQALAAAREHAASAHDGASSDRLGVVLDLIVRAEPVLAHARASEGSGAPAEIAARGTQGPGGALPHLDRIQASFGRHDVSGIRAHVGGQAAASANALGARAYAHGDAVGFASAPDLHTAAHEAAHVVQQRGGVHLKEIDGGASDPLEQHADAVADAVVAGGSAEGLLDAHAGGGGAVRGVQRKGGDKDEDLSLPDNINYLVAAGGRILARTAWLASDPGFRDGSDGTYFPGRAVELFHALKAAGYFTWLPEARIPELSKTYHTDRKIDRTKKVQGIYIGSEIYGLIGPPPGTNMLVIRDGNGLLAVLRPGAMAPGPVETAQQVPLTPEVRQSIWTAVEQYTGMPFAPAVKHDLVNGDESFKPTLTPGNEGVLIPIPGVNLEKLYGKNAWHDYLAKPEASGAPPGAVATDGGVQFTAQVSQEDRTYFLQWVKQLGDNAAAKPAETIITSDVIQRMREIDKHPLKAQILAKLAPKGGGGRPQELDGRLLQNAINAAETEKTQQELGFHEKPGAQAYQPLFPWPVRGNIINRGGLSYVGQTTEFCFETTHQMDAFAVPEVFVQWGVVKKTEPTKLLKTDTTHYLDTERPGTFSFEWPDTGIYVIKAVVTHSFYQPSHFEIEVEVKTEAQRTQELNDQANAGLQGATEEVESDHPYDVSWFNTAVGSHKEEYGKATWGIVPEGYKHLSLEERTQFLATEREELKGFIAAHGTSKESRDQEMVRYAKDELAKLDKLDRELAADALLGATSFDARGSFLSRQNGVPDKALTLLASARKDHGAFKTTIRDLSQVYEPQDYTFTGEGTTWDAATEAAFVHLCKSYPPGRVSCLFEALDDDARPTKNTRGFELDTGTAWKDVKSVVYNDKVKTAINLVGAATMIFLPVTAPVLLPLLGAYNSIDTIDNMRQLAEKGTLANIEIAKGVAEIGLNFLPYLGEVKPVAQLGKVALYTLDGVTLGGQALIMTSDALERLRQLRDRDVMAVADKDAQIRELERTNPSDPKLPGLRAEREALIKQTQAEATETMKGLAENGAMMLMQMSAMHAMSAHVASRKLAGLQRDGAFTQVAGVEPHYDPETGTIRGDRTKVDGGKLAALQRAYEQDMAAKKAELQGILGTQDVEIVRIGSKARVIQSGDGYTIEIPAGARFEDALGEAQRFEKAERAKAPHRAPADTGGASTKVQVESVPRDQLADALHRYEDNGAKVRADGRDPATGKQRYNIDYPDGRKEQIIEGDASNRPGLDSPPSPEEAAAARAAADRAANIQARRDDELTRIIHTSKGPVAVDTAIIGAGQTGTQAFASLRDATGSPPGATIREVPGVINIAPDGSMFGHHATFPIGQKAGDLRGPAGTRSPGEFTANHDGPTGADDFVRALTMTGYDAGMVTYKAQVTSVETRPPGGWGDGVPAEFADMPIRIKAGGKTIYAKRVISAGGLGAPRPLGDSKTPALAAHEPELVRARRLIYAQNGLTVPDGGRVVVVVGDGASGAWACEAALRSGAEKVYWVGRQPEPGTRVDAKARAELAALGLTPDQIETFARAYNARNAPTFRFIETGKIELHIGLADAELDPSGKRVKVTLADAEHPVEVDGIVAATGQELDLPSGLDHLRFKMVMATYNGQERLVALDAIDPSRPDVPLGIRIEGAQMAKAGPLVINTERAAFKKALEDQANDGSVPGDSKGVIGSIHQTNIDVPLANQQVPLVRGGTP